MPVEPIRGVIAPLLTPFNDDLSIATPLYVAHARRLFEQGCAGIAPFGTTGEALSVGIDERIAALRALIDGGIDPFNPSFADIGGDGYDHTNPFGAGVYVGACDPLDPLFDPAFVCNDKLIGGRGYPTVTGSPFDLDGHGSHTASTAGGNFLFGISTVGNDTGAVGGPRIRKKSSNFAKTVTQSRHGNVCINPAAAGIEWGIIIVNSTAFNNQLTQYVTQDTAITQITKPLKSRKQKRCRNGLLNIEQGWKDMSMFGKVKAFGEGV